MQAERYFGTYARFDTLSKEDAAILLGADNPIGDVFEIVLQTDNGGVHRLDEKPLRRADRISRC